jgi:uncharacterized protein (TIGR03083 family)
VNDPDAHDAPDLDLDHLGVLRQETERLARCCEQGPLDAAVPSCPGWDLGTLVRHVGFVHRWATMAAREGAPPTDRPELPEDAALATWLRDGAAALVETLEALPVDAPTWHPFPLPQVAGVWRRRQALETLIHRVDAELATGTRTPIEPALASDGIDEYLALALPRLRERDGVELPAGSLHLHCTDTAGEWLVWVDEEGLQVRREHAKGDAAVRGPAEPMLLRLWHRPTDRAEELDVIGDAAVAEAWLALGGV